jgi:hypothetical protein
MPNSHPAERFRPNLLPDNGLAPLDDPLQRKVPLSAFACFGLIEHDMLKGPWVMGEAYTICDPARHVRADCRTGRPSQKSSPDAGAKQHPLSFSFDPPSSPNPGMPPTPASNPQGLGFPRHKQVTAISNKSWLKSRTTKNG